MIPSRSCQPVGLSLSRWKLEAKGSDQVTVTVPDYCGRNCCVEKDRETLKAVLPTGRVRPRPGRAPPGEADRLNDISETLANDFFVSFRFFLFQNFTIKIDSSTTTTATTTTTTTTTTEKNRKKRSVSQMIDQVMTIKTSTGSSKSELSSRGKRPFKV